MKNIDIKYDDKKGLIHLVIDVKKEIGPSKSGKTIMVATTEGNTSLPIPGVGTIKLGVNCYK